MNELNILYRPVTTEKTTQLQERYNKFAFAVAYTANKHQIRYAVEQTYNVQVTSVRTMIVQGKRKRRGASVGKRPNWKKALVTLAAGQTIDSEATE